jgi:hypothetical protein
MTKNELQIYNTKSKLNSILNISIIINYYQIIAL